VHSPEVFWRRVKNLGVPSDTFYDIGAHRGEFARTVQKFFPKSEFVLFEANPVNENYLIKGNHQYFIVTLYRDEREIPFYALGGTGDSIYMERNLEEYKKTSPNQTYTKSLDVLVRDRSIPLPDLVKIDVQGAELDVLTGGQDTISRAAIVTLELPILQYNKGAPTFDATHNFMCNLGFVPIDLVEAHKIRNCLVQLDLAYIKRTLLDEVYGSENREFII
jgi:FkbM family methyltransferase